MEIWKIAEIERENTALSSWNDDKSQGHLAWSVLLVQVHNIKVILEADGMKSIVVNWSKMHVDIPHWNKSGTWLSSN